MNNSEGMTPNVRKPFLHALIALLLLLAPASAPAATAQKAAPEKAAAKNKMGIAAIVNDEAVTFSDIRNRMNLYLFGSRGTPPDDVRRQMEQQVLQKLIDERLQMQEARSLGIKVEDAQVDEALAQVSAQNKMSPQEFTGRLAQSGVKVSSLRDKLRAEIAWGQVVRRKLRPQVNISESDIDTEIDRAARDAGKTQYHVAEILLTIPSADTESIVRQDADKIVAEIRKGAPFSQVARQYSQSPGASQGGDLGWLQAEQMDPALASALAKMEPGQITPPVKTDKGYHILFLRDRRVAGAAAPAAATPASAPTQAATKPATKPAARPVATPKPQAAANAPAEAEDVIHLMRLVIPIAENELKVVEHAKMERAASLKGEISSCADMSAKAKDYLNPGTGDMGIGPVSKLPEPIRQAVESLPDNELSAPVRLKDGVAVLMVCERRRMVVRAKPAATEEEATAQSVSADEAPAQEEAQEAAAPPEPEPQQQAEAAPGPSAGSSVGAPGDQSREAVANQLGMKRLEQLAERYLKDLRATAYIEKRI